MVANSHKKCLHEMANSLIVDSWQLATNKQGADMVKSRSPYPLRIPPQLRDWMQKAADRNSRSLQGELLHRLNESQRKEEAEVRSSQQ